MGEEDRGEMFPELEFKKSLYHAFLDMCNKRNKYYGNKFLGDAYIDFLDWQNSLLLMHDLFYPLKKKDNVLSVFVSKILTRKKLTEEQANYFHVRLSQEARDCGLTKLDRPNMTVMSRLRQYKK
jgi:hypothetical protein